MRQRPRWRGSRQYSVCHGNNLEYQFRKKLLQDRETAVVVVVVDVSVGLVGQQMVLKPVGREGGTAA